MTSDEGRGSSQARNSGGGHPRSVPRMRDIAAMANVSQSTVSRVLNDAPTRVPIAEATRERVILAARELGYRPNPLARGLRGAATMLLGAVVRDITDPFFAGAVEALSVEAMAHGYNVVLGHAHGRADEAIALTMVLETRHCDAIILLGDMQDQPRLLDDLKDSIVPVVALWQGTSPLDVPTVDVDNRLGIRAGLDHLAGLGHERIAFVSGRPLGDVRERRAAFEEYMHQRFGGLDDRTSARSPTRRPTASRPCVRCWPSIVHRPRWSPPPTRSRSACCTRPISPGGPCPPISRWSASMTSSWPVTPSRRSRRCGCPSPRSCGRASRWPSTSRRTVARRGCRRSRSWPRR